MKTIFIAIFLLFFINSIFGNDFHSKDNSPKLLKFIIEGHIKDCKTEIVHGKTYNRVLINIPYGLDITRLISSYEIIGTKLLLGESESTSGILTNDFSKNLSLTVTGLDNSSNIYSVIIKTNFTILESRHFFESISLKNKRTLDIYLPYDYYINTNTFYKVLYANDGQDMKALNLDKAIGKLITSNQIEKIIVVGIWANGDRMNEYGTSGTLNADGQGKSTHLYESFIINEVIPWINSNYRTKTGAQNTVFMGFSLGGLSAFNITFRNPAIFGKAGLFSGSFWWRDNNTNKQNSRIQQRLVRESKLTGKPKFWFEAGTKEEAADRDQNGTIDAIQDTTELIDELKAKGYQMGPDMVYIEVKGGQHNQASWGKVLPDFLKWAFPN